MSALPFVKICGHTHAPMVEASIALGAHWVGFIFHPGSPRSITPARAAAISSPFVKRVGVFVRQGAEQILDIMQTARLDYAQLHGHQDIETADRIGPERVIRVLWPEACADVASLQAQLDLWAPHCAYFLLDAGKAPQAGGTGKSLDVSLFSQLRFPRPWILAGGLSARNLPELLSLCSPHGVDLNSGVESAPGLKDPSRILAALHAICHSPFTIDN